jgi:hypothetical protein
MKPKIMTAVSAAELMMLSPKYERDGFGAVAVDDDVGIFDDFPRGFEQDAEREPRSKRRARQRQPNQKIERETVNDVREGVPIENVLRIFRTVDDTVPELDVAASADGHAAHCPKNERL